MSTLNRAKGAGLGKDCGAALVVDSDNASQALVVELLGGAGFACDTAKRGDEALASARVKVPWLVISEVRLPDLTGYELCRELRNMFGEQLGIVLLSADRTDPIDRVAGLLLGADDYITKPFDASELRARIQRLAHRLNVGQIEPAETRIAIGSLTGTLTSRERETLILLAQGHRTREIATELSIGEKTVASHLQRALEKLGVHSRAHAVAIAYQDGLVGDLTTSAI
jgi:DNA-binding NarL/FixJ family response regulator